jgi:hypothetical protein
MIQRYADDESSVEIESETRKPPIGPASTFPIPLPKLSKLKTIGPAVTSSVMAVLILAQMAVNPAPKKPYIMAKTIKTGSDLANLHMVRQAIAATVVDKQARMLTGTFRSDRKPKTNWPPT